MLDELKDMLKEAEELKKQIEKESDFSKLLSQMVGLNPFEDGKKFDELVNKASELFDKLDMKKEYGGYSFKELINMEPEHLNMLLNNTTKFSIKDTEKGIALEVCGKQGNIANYLINGISAWLIQAIKDNKLSKEDSIKLIDIMFKDIKKKVEEK